MSYETLFSLIQEPIRNDDMRIAIIGATSTIAKHCARLWLNNQTADLILVGRNFQRLNRLAADLKIRNPQARVTTIQTDFNNPSAIETTVSNIFKAGKVDIALIAHGSLPDQIDCQNNLESCWETLLINGISPVLFAEAFAHHMEQFNNGAIAIISSVAGDRGRKSNYAYGSAKGLVTHYAEGLQHRFYGTKVNVILIKPGPTDTAMTAHLKNLKMSLAQPEIVAKEIIDGIQAKKYIVYTPKKWKVIMLIIKSIPKFIFNKLDI